MSVRLLKFSIFSFTVNKNSLKFFPHSREKNRVNNNKPIYKNRFQPFPFYIIAHSQKANLVNFSLFKYNFFQDSAIGINRNFSSSSYMCIEKNNIKESFKETDTYSNLSKELSDLKNIKTEGSSVNLNSISNPETEILKAGVGHKDKWKAAESKDFFSNNYEKIESNSLATSETNKAESPKVNSETKTEKCGLFAGFILKIKNYYRRILIGVKKGISTPTLPPKTLKLVSNPLIKFLRLVGHISMIICATNRLPEFNDFWQLTIVIFFILNLLFSIYITIVRARNIRKLMKDGAYDVINSPLDRMSSLIARMLACTKGVCETGGTIAGAIAGLYTIDNLMRDMGCDPIFVPFIKRSLTNSSETDVDPTDDCNKQTKNDRDRLKVLEYQLKTFKDEEAALRMFYESKFRTRDEWLELERDFKNRYSVVDGSKKALINNITYNLKKGYGAFDSATDHGLKDNNPTSSKLLEALNSQKFKEDLFP